MAAKYFHNHQERALCMLVRSGYIAALSVSRYNRRLYALADWLEGALVLLAELFNRGEVFIIDSLPLPVCKRVRARRWKKVRGKAFCGYCASKKEKFFGWRLHLICTPEGIPVRFAPLEASYHDLTPIHELCYMLPEEASAYADKAYNSSDDEVTLLTETGVKLVPTRRKNMKTIRVRPRLVRSDSVSPSAAKRRLASLPSQKVIVLQKLSKQVFNNLGS